MNLFKHRLSLICAALLAAGLLFVLIFSSSASTRAQSGAAGALKVNGVDSVNVKVGDTVTISWSSLPTASGSTCALTNRISGSPLNNRDIPLNQRPNGSTSLTVTQAQIVELFCAPLSGGTLIDDWVEINISGQSTPTPPTTNGNFTFLYKEGTTFVPAGGRTVTFISAGSPIFIKVTTTGSVNHCNLTYGGTTYQSLVLNQELTYRTVAASGDMVIGCYSSAGSTNSLGQQSMRVNIGSSAPTPTPTPSPTPQTNSLTINGKTRTVELGQRDFPATLAWTINESTSTACSIYYEKTLLDGSKQTGTFRAANLSSTGNTEVTAAWLSAREVKFILNCRNQPDAANVTLRLKRSVYVLKFRVDEVIVNSGQSTEKPVSGAKICAQKKLLSQERDPSECFSPTTDNNGMAIILFEPDRRYSGGPFLHYIFYAQKTGYTYDFSGGTREIDNFSNNLFIQLKIKQEEGNRVKGQIKDTNGQPIGRSSVALVKKDTVVVGRKYSSSVFVRGPVAADENGGFIFNGDNLNRNLSYQVASVIADGGKWQILGLSEAFRFTNQSQYKNVVYSPPASDKVTLNFSFYKIVGKKKQSVGGDLVTVKVMVDGQQIIQGPGNQSFKFGSADANQKITLSFEAAGYQTVQKPIVVGRSRTISIKLSTTASAQTIPYKNRNKIRIKVEAHTKLGNLNVDGEIVVPDIVGGIKRALSPRRSRDAENIDLTDEDKVVILITDDPGRQIYFQPRASDEATPYGQCANSDDYFVISADTIIAAKDNISSLKIPIERAAGDLKNYRNGNKCNYTSNQPLTLASLNYLNSLSEASKFYQLISPATYGGTGVVSANQNPADTYATTYAIKSLYGSDSRYQNIWNSFSNGFKTIVTNSYLNLVMRQDSI